MSDNEKEKVEECLRAAEALDIALRNLHTGFYSSTPSDTDKKLFVTLDKFICALSNRLNET